jgi:dihydroflavonol-4-reductase
LLNSTGALAAERSTPMRVLVTGGTGFVGCHTVAALVGHGHRVRLLVRAPERIPPALGPLGITQVEVVVGDVTNPATVQQAIAGCDAVVHAASVYSLDPRRAAVMAQTNPTGTDLVLGAAQRQGLDPIIYVSSVGVFWPTTTARLTAGSPLGAGVGPYTRSKLAAELVARGYQQAGVPVVITYPGGVLGPHDPQLSSTVRAIRDVLRGRWPILPQGRVTLVDVREVAALHAALLRPGQGARRYLLASPAVELVDLVGMLGELSGRRLSQATSPDWLLRPASRLADRAQRLGPLRLPVSAEAVAMTLSLSADVEVGDTWTRQELDVQRRDLRRTLADTVRWLAAHGHLTARQAGALAGTRLPPGSLAPLPDPASVAAADHAGHQHQGQVDPPRVAVPAHLQPPKAAQP